MPGESLDWVGIEHKSESNFATIAADVAVMGSGLS